MIANCLICNEPVTLNQDSEEARAAGIDPSQQLRRHLLKHIMKIPDLARTCGFLIDRLLFECPTHSQNVGQRYSQSSGMD